MKELYLAFTFFKKHVFANALIIIEIVFAVFVMTILVNRTTYLYRNYNAFVNTPIDNSIYFMGYYNDWTDNDILYVEPYHDELLNKLDTYASVIDGYSVMAVFSDDSERRILVYDRFTANYLGLFESDNEDSNTLKAIAYNSDVPSGSSLTVNAYLYNYFVTNIDDEQVIEQKTINLEIVDVLEKIPSNLIDSGAMKTNVSFGIEEILADTNAFKDYEVLIVEYDEAIFGDYKFQSDSFFIYFNELANAEQIAEISEILDQYGTYQYGQTIIEETKLNADSQFQYDIYTFMAIAIICAISLVSITFLNIKKMMHYISIYYINGCSFRKAMQIYLLYLFSLIFLSMLLFGVLMGYMQYILEMKNTHLLPIYTATFGWNSKNQAISFAVVLLVLLIGSYFPFRHISNKALIRIIKEER